MAAPEQQTSLAADLFEDMHRKVDQASREGYDGESEKLVEEIESLCMKCHEDGTTRLLLTRIPKFREIVIMSFACDHCGFHNSEVQPAGQIQERGISYKLKVEKEADISRQIVKSDTCIFRVEDIDLEIPPGRGQLTNVEGILKMVAEDLQSKQDERKEVIPDVWVQLEGIITTLNRMASGEHLPFTITINDPAGNSWIEFSPDDSTNKYFRHEYARSAEQNAALGLGDAAQAANGDAPDVSMRPEYQASHMVPAMPADRDATNVDQKDDDDDDIIENQVYTFPAQCPGCTSDDCVTNMKMVNIPHFKQVVIMSTVCDHCGYRSNEVKTGGEVPEKGRRITLKVNGPEDLSRDILKSETCAMECPEIQLSVEPGTLGGRFTTVEGLLRQVRDDLHKNIFSDEDDAGGGDSMATEERQRWNAFFAAVDSAIKGEQKFTLVLQDPFAASYVQSLAKEGVDSQITVEDYERTEEEEQELGLRDINVDEDHINSETQEDAADGDVDR